MTYEWSIEQAFDLYTLTTHFTINREATSISPAIDLMRHGWIAKTPEKPSAAVSIKTLQLFYRLRQRKSSLGAEAFAKVICDYYRVSNISGNVKYKSSDQRLFRSHTVSTFEECSPTLLRSIFACNVLSRSG